MDFQEVRYINAIVTNDSENVDNNGEITSNERKDNKIDDNVTDSNNVIAINEICIKDE